jgi:hypothetical protein
MEIISGFKNVNSLKFKYLNEAAWANLCMFENNLPTLLNAHYYFMQCLRYLKMEITLIFFAQK